MHNAIFPSLLLVNDCCFEACQSYVYAPVLSFYIMSNEFSQRQLFGGSITCDIPASWRDVSNVRQVPDHQEVYQGLSENPIIPGPCLIVELVEHQEVTNDEAAAFFFRDLANANGVTSPEEVTFTSTQPLSVSPMLLSNNATCCAGIGMQMVSHGRDVDFRGNPTLRNPHWVTLELCVLRFPHVGTDLLITLSQPRENPNEAEPLSFSPIFSHVVETIQVRDWNLFG
jgi:hypothetical protein